MKDGFYLSTYIHIDPVAFLYNFHIRHDQNISLWKKTGKHVELVHHWELERITGLKRQFKSFCSVEQAKELIGLLLETYNLKIEDLAGIFGNPMLDTVTDYHSVKDNDRISYHSIAHLYSSLLINSDVYHNEDIIAMALDGGPDNVIDRNIYEKYYYAGAVSRKGKVELFPLCSPGFLWTYLRKRYNMREGTLMALATASASEFFYEDEEIVKVYQTKDLKKAYEYVEMLDKKVSQLKPEDEGVLYNFMDPKFSIEDNKISMVAKIVQNMSYKIIKFNVDWIVENYGIDPEKTYIAISGGFGLNCPSNSYLMEHYNFKGFLAPPCVNDAGISIGMGLYYFNKEIEDLSYHMESSYYGNADDSLEELLKSGRYNNYIDSCKELDSEQFIKDIETDPIVWFDGQAESGPRALGHRSLLVAPDTTRGKDELNRIKKRQWWRPVAPIVIYEEMDQWFEHSFYSPFMLHTLQVKEDKVSCVPAICHIDNSARVQSMKRKDNEVLYDLITAYKEKSGIPIICNTSLNDAGEPIIDNIEECLNFALRKGINVVYINGKRLELKNQEQYPEDRPRKRIYDMECFTKEELKQIEEEKNPYKVEENILIHKYSRPDFGDSIDLTCEEDVKKLRIFGMIANRKYGKVPVPGINIEGR